MTETPTTSSRTKLFQAPSIAVAITLFLLPLVYFFPAVMGQVTLAPGDGWTQIFGIRVLIGHMIAQGELPLWNPYIFGGMPLLASIQPGALYPPTWLFAVLAPKVAMNVLVLTTYHLALFGTYLFARRLGCHRIGALIAAVMFSFSGFMVSHMGHTNRINATAWLPWILLAVDQLSQRPRWRWVALGAAFIALQQFAGEPQMTLYSGMLAGAYALFLLVGQSQPGTRARFMAALAAMSVCGALLSMIQLLPARELLALGDRSAIDYSYFSQFSFPPRQMFELFFPYYFGGAALEPYRVSYWGTWNLAETCGYIGMVGWLLAFAAVFAAWQLPAAKDKLIWKGKAEAAGVERNLILFWTICVLMALLLAFGSYLPFGIHKLLHRLPVYSLFRASGRHLMQFDFALAILAGLGATALTQLDRVKVRQVLAKSSVLLSVIVAVALIVYKFFDHYLEMGTPLPPQAGSWSNPDIYIPAVFFVLSLAALWLYSRRSSALAGIVLVGILFLDIFAWGFFFEWRLITNQYYNVAEHFQDSASVKAIKEREPDWNSFRVVSHAEIPFGLKAALLDYPNISIVRGLQSLNGYDPVRLGQMAEIAGRMTLDGYVTEQEAFDSTHQGFNLLNAKYLLADRATASNSQSRVQIEDVTFADPPIGLLLNPQRGAQFQVRATADELVVISAMGNSDNLAQGTPVLVFTLKTSDGRVIERELQAGRDVSEWALEREDVKARAKHGLAHVVETWDAGGFPGHRYLARLKFDRAEITDVQVRYVASEADITMTRASFYDSQTKASQPLDTLSLPLDRWRELAEFGDVRLYENLKVMPRAWFCGQAVIEPSAEVLQSIKGGKLKDGSSFDPARTVLLESELFGNRQIKTPLANSATAETPKGDVKVTRYTPHRIEIEANNPTAGFLVLSEIYYRGWEVWVDGQRVPVERVNFTLRGVELTPGNHKVEFVFRAPSFRNGASWSAFGVVLLVAGGIVSRKRRRSAV